MSMARPGTGRVRSRHDYKVSVVSSRTCGSGAGSGAFLFFMLAEVVLGGTATGDADAAFAFVGVFDDAAAFFLGAIAMQQDLKLEIVALSFQSATNKEKTRNQ